MIDVFLEFIEREGGLVSVRYDKPDWLVAVEFGQEAPASGIVAGAAYGVAPTLDEAIGQVRRELKI